LELPIIRIARSFVEAIVIKFLAQEIVEISVGEEQVQKKLLCVTQQLNAPYKDESG